MTTASKKRARLLTVAAVVTFPILFIAFFLLGVVLHLPLPSSRRAVTRIVMDQVSHAIRGSIEIETISKLSFGGFEAKSVTIRDPEGSAVLHAPVLRTKANLIGIGLSLLPWEDSIRIPISWIHVEHVDVFFRADADGPVSLATTFLTPLKAVLAPTTPSKPSRPVFVNLHNIEINNVKAQGKLGGLSPVDWRAQSLHAVVSVAPETVTVDVASFPLSFHGILNEPITTTVDYRFRSPSLMWTRLIARYGDISLSGHVKLDGEELKVDMDLPQTQGSAFRSFLPDSVSIVDQVRGKLTAQGSVSELQTSIRLYSDTTTVTGKGKVTLSPQFRTDLETTIRALNLQKVLVEGPESEIDGDFRVRLGMGQKGNFNARISGNTSPTQLYAFDIPGMDIDALLDPSGVSGEAHIHEMGMPIRADFSVTDQGRIRVTATANVPSLSIVPRLQHALGGYAVAKLEGSWEKGKLDASVSAQGGNLTRDGLGLGSANVDLRVWGAPEKLQLNASLQGARLDLGGMKWDGVTASLQGPIEAPRLQARLRDHDLPQVTVVAGLDPRGFSAQGVDVKLEKGEQEVEIQTDRIEVHDGVVDFGALAIDGLGEPIDAFVRVASTGFDVRIVSDGIDLNRLSRLVTIPGSDLEGTLGVDVDLNNVGDDTRGCLRLDLQDGKASNIPFVSDIDLALHAQFRGRHMDVEANASMGGDATRDSLSSHGVGMCLPARPVRDSAIVKTRVTAALALGGPPERISSWRQMTGSAQIEQLAVDLTQVQKRAAGPLAAIGMALSGMVQLKGGFVRDQLDVPPTWAITGNTTNLDISWGSSDKEHRVKGADLAISASMDRTGELQSTMCIRNLPGIQVADVCDVGRQEVLANLSLRSQVDYQRFFENPKTWDDVLSQAHIDAQLEIPDRPVDSLLRPFQLEDILPVIAERARATVAWQGTILEPKINYSLGLSGVGSRDLAWRTSASVCAQGAYDGKRASLQADLRQAESGLGMDRTCSPHPDESTLSFGNLEGDLSFAWRDLIAWHSGSWEANLKAMIHGFELATIPAFGDNGVSGRALLVGSLKGLGNKPEIDVQLGIENLRTGPSIDYDQSHFRIHTDSQKLQGSLAFIDVDEKGNPTSSLTLAVDTEQVQWANGWQPTRDGSKPVNVAVESNRFKLGMLSPLFQPVFSYVEGELTGKAEATWDPEKGKSRIDQMYFYVDNGAFQVPAIGQEFLQVKGALLAADSDRIYVNSFRAQSLTGQLEGQATIDLHDLDIQQVDASLWTPGENQIRLTFSGIPVGDLAGNIEIKIVPSEKQNDVTVILDKVHVELPRTDMRSVQQLDNHPEIEISPALASTTKRHADTETKPWVVSLETKTPVVLQRYDMYFRIMTPDAERERVTLTYPDSKTGEATLVGHVLLYDGRIDVIGRRFDLEENNARVIFDGDPGDPKLSVTARWDGPDGTRVFADVTGPLKDPRIQFRSEPAMPQAEILALVIFGPQVEGSGTTTVGTEGEGSGATDMSGEVASAGINMLLQDLNPAISTRIDTSRGQSPSPTVIVQVSPSITAEATYVAEEATLDKTDRYLLTFDWRFLRRWSLRLTRGNVGTSILDVIWQHRY